MDRSQILKEKLNPEIGKRPPSEYEDVPEEELQTKFHDDLRTLYNSIGLKFKPRRIKR